MRRCGHGIWFIVAVAAVIAVMAAGCTDDRYSPYIIPSYSPRTDPGTRTPSPVARKVFILYSCGYNNLASYLKKNIDSLSRGYLPSGRKGDDVLLVFSKTTAKSRDYTTPMQPALFRLYRGMDGKCTADTVLTLPSTAVAADPATMKQVLTYVRDNYQSNSYGMVFSSHATGWLPLGYYANPYKFDGGSSGDEWFLSAPRRAFRYSWPEEREGFPMVKTVGQEQSGSVSWEMSLKDFAEAIPMHMDYILFDACFMGCVETAYELRNVCSAVGFSPAEILGDGYDYTGMGMQLLRNSVPDPSAVLADYVARYDAMSGVWHSAVASLVDCSRMDDLAALCKELFQTHRAQLQSADASRIQPFFGGSKHWFYDLGDILDKAGITAAERARLDAILSDAVIYKGHTGQYYSDADQRTHKIETFSGLTMFLPSMGSTYLNAFYRDNISWNDATELVK